mmetsp:Transcript_115497/g.361268  ORF Transcript_115497/g.361268 Transcript_115497/m.361268 type:complete len:579 (-) Transcript_115497:192-1928(-)
MAARCSARPSSSAVRSAWTHWPRLLACSCARMRPWLARSSSFSSLRASVRARSSMTCSRSASRWRCRSSRSEVARANSELSKSASWPILASAASIWQSRSCTSASVEAASARQRTSDASVSCLSCRSCQPSASSLPCSTAARSAAAALAAKDEKGICGLTEDGVEYHTSKHDPHPLKDITSAEMCCAECEARAPACGAWTWGKVRDVVGLSDLCFLKALKPGEVPVKLARKEVVSGLPSNTVKKHGIAASLRAEDHKQARAEPGVRLNETCVGMLSVGGYRGGNVTVKVVPGESAGKVEVMNRAWVVPHLSGQAYFADECSSEAGGDTDYAAVKVLGKTLRYTTRLAGAGCGCNANFYGVRLGAGCDGSGARPANCEEIDFFEGNKWAWHSTVHTLNDAGQTDANGLCTGYGGTLPTRPNFPSFSSEEYGPDGTMIDTTKPFSVAASFPKRKDGKLKGMSVELSQEGKPSMEQPLFMHIYEYKGSAYNSPAGPAGTAVENGMAKIEARLTEGITMLSSMWKAPGGGMRWLDGAASAHGPNNIMDGKCTWDGTCSGYSISKVQVEELPAATPSAMQYKK